MIDVSRRLDPGEEPLCPLCDNPILLYGDWEIVMAHGAFFLAHASCVEDE